MLAWTRRRVSSEIGRLPLSTYETVLIDTPACDATSAIVAIGEHHTCHVEALRLVCPNKGETARGLLDPAAVTGGESDARLFERHEPPGLPGGDGRRRGRGVGEHAAAGVRHGQHGHEWR